MASVAVHVRPLQALRNFAELSVVRLARSINIDGRSMAKGSCGTVVAAYHDGIGYEVEFEHPFHAVVTLDVRDLTA